MCDATQLELAKLARGKRNPFVNPVAVAFLLCLAIATTGCGSLGSQNTGSANADSSNSPVALSLTPSSATLGSLQQLQFTARVSGTSNTAVTWSTSAGSISRNGFFTAPKVSSITPVLVTATHESRGLGSVPTSPGGRNANAGDPVELPAANGRAIASVTVMVTPSSSSSSAVAITTSNLPAADASQPYSASLSATGGIAPYQWSLASGSLPSGIQLHTATGAIAGVAALAGSYPLTAKVTDASGHSATAPLKLMVSSASASGFDGPAELPRTLIQTAMVNTPAAARAVTLSAGQNLQSALDSASCGDTIQLQAGATYTGVFTFPAKSCDDNQWIVVRTNADDSLLPAEGSRLTPCYAGVSSLPARPAFHCASTANVLPKLVGTAGNDGPIIFASGANHYRLIGLEITRAPLIGRVTALVSIASGGTANNLILDRVWLHGTAQDETTRGVWLEGGTYVSIVDSFFTDFHCVSRTGVCGDAQAISGGIGTGPAGPYKIVNNFLEASGENILFGGGTANSTPADIQISQNHMFKPLIWKKGQPGYVGGTSGDPFVVKNLLELKNAQRVLVEGNILENSWGGFSQVGFAILLTPKNQALSNVNVCPTCLVTDVTIRNNFISHVGAGLQIANALAGTGAAMDGQRYSIHDVIIDDISDVKYDGPGEVAQISVQSGAPLLQNLTIDHITAFPSRTLFVVGDMVASGSPMRNFAFTNSIVNSGDYPIWSTGGGPENCAYADKPLNTFNACFTSSAFSTNAIIAPSGGAAAWPGANFFPASAAAVQFVNFNSGNGGDYHLLASSPYKGKATDGKDLGADIDAVNSAISGVE